MRASSDRIRIVLAGGFLADYPQGGGHWTVFLQYLLGLAAFGHDVYWLELFREREDQRRDDELIATFFSRMAEFGLSHRCVLLRHGREVKTPTLATGQLYGMSA